jgi:hypothetical protein
MSELSPEYKEWEQRMLWKTARRLSKARRERILQNLAELAAELTGDHDPIRKVKQRSRAREIAKQMSVN